MSDNNWMVVQIIRFIICWITIVEGDVGSGKLLLIGKEEGNCSIVVLFVIVDGSDGDDDDCILVMSGRR